MSQFSVTLIPSTVVTATLHSSAVQNTPPLPNGNIIINVTARTSGSITPSIESLDPASGTYYTVLTGTAMSAVGQQVLHVGPSFPATANVSATDILPSTWRVTLTAAGSTSLTASVGINLTP